MALYGRKIQGDLNNFLKLFKKNLFVKEFVFAICVYIDVHFRTKFEMSKQAGGNCSVLGCRKRQKGKGDAVRSDSDWSSDEESPVKRMFDRTFHR